MANSFRGIVRGQKRDQGSGWAAILLDVPAGETVPRSGLLAEVGEVTRNRDGLEIARGVEVYADWRAADQIVGDLADRWVEVGFDGDQPVFRPIPEPDPGE